MGIPFLNPPEFFRISTSQLIENWWFGILGVPLTNNPFLGIQTTNPNHSLAIIWTSFFCCHCLGWDFKNHLRFFCLWRISRAQPTKRSVGYLFGWWLQHMLKIEWSNLTNLYQMGWNHQLENIITFFSRWLLGHGFDSDSLWRDVLFFDFYFFGSSFCFFLWKPLEASPTGHWVFVLKKKKIPFGRSFSRGMVGQHWGKVNKLFPPEKTLQIGFLYVPEISQIDTQNRHILQGNAWKIPFPFNHPFPKHDVWYPCWISTI